MILSVTFSRTSLGLPDLVISNDATGAFWLPEDGIEEPDVDMRYTYMPTHPDVVGRSLIGAAEEHGSMPLPVYTKAADMAGLEANKATLRAAVRQFNYNLTLNVDGQANTYSADCSLPKWSALDSGMVRGRIARASLVIPVYPIAS